MAGIDLATNTPAPQFLAPHNEMIYNPQPNDVIGLYCLQEADAGGESLMVWNRDYANSVPAGALSYQCLPTSYGMPGRRDWCSYGRRRLTCMMPSALKDFVIEHGGIAYERKYHDASRPGPAPPVRVSSVLACAYGGRVSALSFAFGGSRQARAIICELAGAV